MDKNKTKAQLIAEIDSLRQHIFDLEQTKSKNDINNKVNLHESEEKLQLLIESSTDMVSLHDLDGRYTYYSGPEKYKINASDIVGKMPTDLFDPEEAENIITHIKQATTTGKSNQFEALINWQGVPTIFLEKVFPIYRNNKIIGATKICSDITFQKKNEDLLASSEERLKILFESAPDAYYLIDLKGNLIDGNKAAEKLMGYKREELIGKNYKDLNLLSIRDLPKALKNLAKNALGRGSGPDEYKLSRKDGTKIIAEIRTHPVKINNKTVVLGIARDVTNRKKTEQALLQSEKKFRDLFENMNDGFALHKIIVDKNGKAIDYEFLEVNPIFAERVGMKPKDIINKRALELFPQTEQYWIDTFGEVALTGKPSRLTNYSAELGRHYETKIYCPSKGYFAALFTDITENISAEEEKNLLEAQLRRSQKMETIGTLAGGIAHDFNNILTPILGYSDMSLEELSKSNPIRNNIEQVSYAANRAKDLIEQILLFSKQIEKEQNPLYIHLIIKEALKLMRSTIPSTIKIVEKIDQTCDKVLADTTQIHQVVINLCTNAWQAMENKGGTLTVELKQIEVDKNMVLFNPKLKQKEYVCLTIHDTGHGMNKDIIERIFEPFFTTKAVDKGTGLGLSVVHGIVQNHKGEILVDSKPDSGSVFHVYLPVAKNHQRAKSAKLKDALTGKENILIVDDNHDVGVMLKKMLEKFGYSIDLFHSSIESLEVFKKQPAKYDLIISDLTMPDLTGIELSEQIQKIKTDLPLIIMTGYGNSLLGIDKKSYGIKRVIEKPIVMNELASIIREVLDNQN